MKWLVNLVGHAYGTDNIGTVEAETEGEAFVKAEMEFNIHEGDEDWYNLAVRPATKEENS